MDYADQGTMRRSRAREKRWLALLAILVAIAAWFYAPRRGNLPSLTTETPRTRRRRAEDEPEAVSHRADRLRTTDNCFSTTDERG